MKNKKKKGFTLVELLAVIVILAIILVIAVPKIMETIKNAKKGSMESSAKLIAKSVETNYQVSLASGEEGTLSLTGSCLDSKFVDADLNEYESCTYTITDGKAKVTLKGKDSGKFSGLVCKDATKTVATCSSEESGNNTLTGNAAEVLISQLDNNIGLEKLMYDSEWNEVDNESSAVNIEYRFTGAGDHEEYVVTDVDTCKANFNAETNNALDESDIISLCNGGGVGQNNIDIRNIILGYEISYDNISSYINKNYVYGNVKNYVTFNNEMWRIIGIFKDKLNNYQLKIIKDESIGELVWDGAGVRTYNSSNIWIGSEIQVYLSEIYYPTLTNISKEMIDTSDLFNDGTVDDFDDGSVLKIKTKEAYKAEKNNRFYYEYEITDVEACKANFKTEIDAIYPDAFNQTDVDALCNSELSYDLNISEVINIFEIPHANISSYINGKLTKNAPYIGLMTLSDYGYAASKNCRDNYYINNTYNYNEDKTYADIVCIYNNWMYKSDEEDYWMMTGAGYDSSYAWHIYFGGGATFSGTCSNRNYSLPVVFLKSSVQITGGTGTSTDPYTLDL